MAVKTREKLIEVARQLFVHKGVAKTTMNDIAEASAKGRRTIYTYFRNKREIYNAVIESESDRLVTSLRCIAEEDAPITQKLERFMIFRLQNNILQDVTLTSWLKLDMRRIVRLNKLIQDKVNGMLSGLLEEGVAAGVFDAARCALLSEFIFQCFNTFDLNHDDSADRTQSIEALVRFIITDISLNGTVFADEQA